MFLIKIAVPHTQRVVAFYYSIFGTISRYGVQVENNEHVHFQWE